MQDVVDETSIKIWLYGSVICEVYFKVAVEIIIDAVLL